MRSNDEAQQRRPRSRAVNGEASHPPTPGAPFRGSQGSRLGSGHERIIVAFPLPSADFTQTMVAIDRHFDHLKMAHKAGWEVSRDHPDIDPPHEALQLWEQFRELRRQPTMMKKPADFQNWLREGEEGARALEMLLHQAKQNKSIDAKAVDRAFTQAATACNACHAKNRD